MPCGLDGLAELGLSNAPSINQYDGNSAAEAALSQNGETNVNDLDDAARVYVPRRTRFAGQAKVGIGFEACLDEDDPKNSIDIFATVGGVNSHHATGDLANDNDLLTRDELQDLDQLRLNKGGPGLLARYNHVIKGVPLGFGFGYEYYRMKLGNKPGEVWGTDNNKVDLGKFASPHLHRFTGILQGGPIILNFTGEIQQTSEAMRRNLSNDDIDTFANVNLTGFDGANVVTQAGIPIMFNQNGFSINVSVDIVSAIRMAAGDFE